MHSRRADEGWRRRWGEIREKGEDWGWKGRRRRRWSTSGSATPGLIDRIWKCRSMLRDGAPKENHLFFPPVSSTRSPVTHSCHVPPRSGAAAYGRRMSSFARGKEWGEWSGNHWQDMGRRVGAGGQKMKKGEEEEAVVFGVEFWFFSTTLYLHELHICTHLSKKNTYGTLNIV